MRNSRFEVRPTSGALGAELLGIDLSDSLDAESAADIRQTLNEHGVIFFRDQRLSPKQHIAFAERMGTININRFFKTVPGYPQIAEVRKEPVHTTNIGGGWHTDQSYDQIPALGSILLAREVPPRGGDTMFASMGQAYDALSDGTQEDAQGFASGPFEPTCLRRQGSPSQSGTKRSLCQRGAGNSGCSSPCRDPPS